MPAAPTGSASFNVHWYQTASVQSRLPPARYHPRHQAEPMADDGPSLRAFRRGGHPVEVTSPTAPDRHRAPSSRCTPGKTEPTKQRATAFRSFTRLPAACRAVRGGLNSAWGSAEPVAQARNTASGKSAETGVFPHGTGLCGEAPTAWPGRRCATGVARHGNFFHGVQFRFARAGPRRRWAGAWIAFAPRLHKKRTQSPSAGGG